MDGNATQQIDEQNSTPLDQSSSGSERLWTPWRMRYVGGGAAETGCLFCNRLASDDDVRSLLLYRDDHAFVIMNLFPYNTGHVMIVPNDHVATPEEAEEATLGAMGALLRPTLRGLRRVLNADGFNVGINVGAVAGAGVADHLHQHVVPRWQGDANFMPILASTMVLPELIPVTYAKLRAELGREFASLADSAVMVTVVVLSEDLGTVLLVENDGQPSLPSARAAPGESLWRAAGRLLTDKGIDAALAGWAGPMRAATAEHPALTFLALSSCRPTGALRFEALAKARKSLDRAADRDALDNAAANLASART
jgi:ATP adenylyltransferase